MRAMQAVRAGGVGVKQLSVGQRKMRRGGVSVPQEQEPAPEHEQEHTGRAQEHALGNQPASQPD
jgi:hypothetical protein